MLSEELKKRLQSNWGDRVDALACYAEARLFDLLSSWECYLLAQDPEELEEVKCIIVDENKEIWVIQTSLQYLLGRWNEEGECMELDKTFVRRESAALFKTLNERYPQRKHE